MTNIFFIAGTGTDIGKTYVTCQLIKQLKRQSTIHAIKPIISGWDSHDPSLDTFQLLDALGIEQTNASIETISPWRFKAPLTPSMAAKQEGAAINLSEVSQWCHEQAHHQDTLLIEGVGGIMAPITDTETSLDWITMMNIPVILVTGSYLGTLSHTLTAVSCLKERQIPIRHIIVSQSPDNDVDIIETCQIIEQFSQCQTHIIYRNQTITALNHDL